MKPNYLVAVKSNRNSFLLKVPSEYERKAGIGKNNICIKFLHAYHNLAIYVSQTFKEIGYVC